MKKVLAGAMAAVLLLASGCGTAKDSGGDGGQTLQLAKEDMQLVYDSKNLKESAKKVKDLGPFCKKIAFTDYGYAQGGDDMEDKHRYRGYYNMDTGEFTFCAKTYMMFFGGNSEVIMNDNYYYFWGTMALEDDPKLEEGENIPTRLFQIDTKNKKMKVIEQNHASVSSCGLLKLNESEFISVRCDYTEKTKTTKYIFEKRDGKTGKGKTILESSYKDGDSEGEEIVSYSAQNNQLLLMVARSENGVKNHYVMVFDKNGKKQYEIDLSKINGELTSETTLDFEKINDYLVINNYGSNQTFICKIEEGVFKEYIMDTNSGLTLCNGTANHWDSQKSPYIYFYKQYEYDNNPNSGQAVSQNTPLRAFNLQTGETKEIDFPKEDGFTLLENLQIDEYGNLLITVFKEGEEGTKRVYFVSAEALEKVLGGNG